LEIAEFLDVPRKNGVGGTFFATDVSGEFAGIFQCGMSVVRGLFVRRRPLVLAGQWYEL